MENNRYGRWTILKDVGPHPKSRGRVVIAKCDCGNWEKRDKASIVKGKSTQCKLCFRRQRIKAAQNNSAADAKARGGNLTTGQLENRRRRISPINFQNEIKE